MLEKMGEFFDSRLDIYDEHQLTCIDSAKEFFNFTAEHLPKNENCHVLDLGCGTGLELESYFKINPTAEITGIDLAPGMLGRLKEKFADKNLNLILGSYFEVPFGESEYDAAVSVESIHHFTAEQKIPLYKKLYESLKDGGYFILTDYFAQSDDEEKQHFDELAKLKAEQNINDGEFYHYDTPLTVEHEIDCLISAGFESVEVLNHWSATHTLKAVKNKSDTICGINCNECMFKLNCRGCRATCGNPFGGKCIAAEYIKIGGKSAFEEFKSKLIDEINSLEIEGMPKVEQLFCLCGSFVNLEYTLPNGEKIKYLNDGRIYLGCQVPCLFDESKCFGAVVDNGFILVCVYGENGSNPELVMYKRR